MRPIEILTALFLSCAAHRSAPEAVAWDRIEKAELGKPTEDKSALSCREKNLVSECDRFVADFPSSPQRDKAAYVAALVFHAHGQLDEASRRYQAIARAPTPDQTVCEPSIALLLGMGTKGRGFGTRMQLMREFEETTCELAAEPTVLQPTFAGDGLADPGLDRLSFLDGCFVNEALRLCWHREGPRWVGLATPLGLKERATASVGLHIAHGPSGLVFTAGAPNRWLEPRPWREFLENYPTTVLTRLATNEVAFGSLVFSDGRLVEQLRRTPERP